MLIKGGHCIVHDDTLTGTKCKYYILILPNRATYRLLPRDNCIGLPTQLPTMKWKLIPVIANF